MKFRLIYPSWKKMERQTEFHLPPHGPVVFAATLPPDWEVEFIDENVEPLPADDGVDFVGISMMLTCQVKRGWEIADDYRRRGLKVICGGIGTMLHADFILEIGLDLAEFTVLTPFPHTRAFEDFEREKRILTYDWDAYTADRVVFQPRMMSPARLQELLTCAWESFYREEPQNYRMFKLFKQVVEREKADGTFRPRRRELAVRRFGREGGPRTVGETTKS